MSGIKERLTRLSESAMGTRPPQMGVAEVCLDAVKRVEELEEVIRQCRRHALAECPTEPLKEAICRITYDAGINA